MDDVAAVAAEVRAQLNEALRQLDTLIDGEELSPEEREAISVAVMVVRRYRERSMHALLQWFRDVKAGRESWIVARSLPGEHRADAWYVPEMPAHLQRKLTH